MDYKSSPDKAEELLMTSFLERDEPEEIYCHSLHLLILHAVFCGGSLGFTGLPQVIYVVIHHEERSEI